MAIDYESHPADLPTVTGGTTKDQQVGVKQLRDAIPAHCWKPSHVRGLSILARDIFMVALFPYLAVTYIPQIPDQALRFVAWAFYGWLEGLVFTGLWVIGHESGHGAFSSSPFINDFVGFIVHSALFTPYFAWKSSHRRHHIYANNMEKDHNYVPTKRDDYLTYIGEQVHEAAEDAPLYVLARVVLQQLIGWPWYLLTNITAAPTSLARQPAKYAFGNSHFVPSSALFRKEERGIVMASNAGLIAVACFLYYLGEVYGSWAMMVLYVQPYLWVNHWIVAVTYLHHTHPDLPKFEPEAWTFIKGATATVDRDLGFIDRFFFHNVIGFHVVHHLFSKIPFYHTEEATRAIQPLLGPLYREDKNRSYLPGLFESMTKCQYVVADNIEDPKNRALWYKAGRMPAPEYNMARKGWSLKFW